MGIAKCSFCSKEVSEVGKFYYEAWEKKKKEDVGMGGKEKIFCQNCWPEQEKNYRNYPCDTEEVKKGIIKQKIEKKTSTSWTASGDWICYDPVKKEWVKEGEWTPTQPENKPPQKNPQKENKSWIIWVILAAVVLVILLLLLGLWLVRPAKKKKKTKKSQKKPKIN